MKPLGVLSCFKAEHLSLLATDWNGMVVGKPSTTKAVRRFILTQGSQRGAYNGQKSGAV